jgi:hypothetical protein
VLSDTRARPDVSGPQAAAAPAVPASERWLERLLTGAGHLTIDSEHLRLLLRSGLAPYAFDRGVADEPAKQPLRHAFLLATGRHLKLRAALQTLFRAWSGAGIDILLFKGFYLAEFVYRTPGLRFYRDVDVLMDPARSRDASRIAESFGWIRRWHASDRATMWTPYDEGYCGHEVMHLEHPGLGVTVDVHKRILHNLHDRVPWHAPQTRITAAVWRASNPVVWGGAAMRVLAPPDAILIAPVLNRYWSVWDDWALKPHDYLDFTAIVERFGVTRAALEARARELGCCTTLRLFLQRCNPFQQHLNLSEPTRRDRQRWNMALAIERGHPGLARRLVGMIDWPGELLAAVHQLPLAMQIARLVRRRMAAADIARTVAPCAAETGVLGHREWWRLQRATARILALIGTGPAAYRDVYVLTLYAALRRRGCPVALREAAPLDIEWLGRGLVSSRMGPTAEHHGQWSSAHGTTLLS